jgi:hypothetical protein
MNNKQTSNPLKRAYDNMITMSSYLHTALNIFHYSMKPRLHGQIKAGQMIQFPGEYAIAALRTTQIPGCLQVLQMI